MTEFEYAELIATYSSNAGTFFTTYLTVLSGYLITAFVAGQRLNMVQVSILNAGYVVAVLVLIWGTYGAGMVQVYYTNMLLEIAPNSAQAGKSLVFTVLGALMFCGMLASLLFMWNSRRSSEN